MEAILWLSLLSVQSRGYKAQIFDLQSHAISRNVVVCRLYCIICSSIRMGGYEVTAIFVVMFSSGIICILRNISIIVLCTQILLSLDGLKVYGDMVVGRLKTWADMESGANGPPAQP